MKKNGSRVILFYLALIAVIFVAVFAVLGTSTEPKDINFSDIMHYFEEDRVKEFEVSNENIITLVVYKSDKVGVLTPEDVVNLETEKISYKLRDVTIFRDSFEKYEGNLKNLQVYEYEPLAEYPWWISLLPNVLLIIVMVVLGIYMTKQMNKSSGGMMSFGKAKAHIPQGDKNKVTFADVAGAEEEKAELVEIVEFLKDPEKFAKLGAKIPHGVLLVGPPGTGKTLLAKAVAGEAGVPFFSMSGSDFVEMYVGVGASRVRDLFATARKAPAAIIFIDEIDAVGRHRGAGLGGGHDEREQTLNQLLVEMDGFGTHEGIIIIAATNRADILDPALLRPGRFDRQVRVGYPDIKGREEILKVHARRKPMESTVDFHKIAQSTIGFTGADLANLLNEAALHAAKNNKSLIGMDDIEKSYMKILLGPQKKTRVRTEADNKLTAYHEAGHAVASYYCEHTDPVKFISTVPSGNYGGVTVSIPEQDTFTSTKKQMYESIILSMGGRVAEELILDDISTGASGDIQQATKVARNMVTRYGMSDKLGTVLYGSGHSDTEVFLGRDFNNNKNYSEKIAAEIDDEIRAIIEKAYAECKAILTEHIDKLHLIAGYLLKREFMDGDQFKAAMENDLTFDEIDEILKEKERKSQEENEAKRKAEEEEQRKVEEELRREKEERERMMNAPKGETYDDSDAKSEESVDKE
ncbi:MAG: ATP-dependent zinc metalloprotease FtsH [Clostridia bacterium]|nr:ATP-dependent zinc metalloprotease FtsH [Clostridia bacterium]